MVFGGEFMRGEKRSMAARSYCLAIIMLASVLLSGCTNPIGPPEPTASLTVDVDQINSGEPINFDARESSTPDATVITQFSWDFGDGSKTTTTQGLTNHVYSTPGTYEASLIVENDRGGTDETHWTIHVNAYPVIELLSQPMAKVGESITLNAEGSSDPEGGVLAWAWDLDLSDDSDGDGDSRNDVDSSAPSITMLLNKSGEFEGAVVVTDDRGASAREAFQINVSTRTWQVTWEQQRVTEDWDGYLKQGESWTYSHVPGIASRLMEVNATLTLTMDTLPIQMPQDNFTLRLAVPISGWNAESATSQENVTKGPTAYIERDGMNPVPTESSTYQSDYSEDLLRFILDNAAARFGQGNWTWQVTADQADPDFLVDDIDPDEGNDWKLEVEFIILVPRISEVFE
ncbi:MAG TPA: PKD domain-containing protein [Candidatus Poseidoniales archaeon]|nr:PKD domain-containing protein [Candidatus Poseidoniales archaeon]